MSQQLLQQDLSYQFHSGVSANAEGRQAQASGENTLWQQSRSRARIHFSPRLLARVVGFTAFLLALAMAYIAANALAAGADYQRQQMQNSAALLREENAKLRCQISQAADLARISQFAQATGMRPADPAAESDFLAVTPTIARSEVKRQSWFSKAPVIAAIFASQFNASYASGRAEASVPVDNRTQKQVSH